MTTKSPGTLIVADNQKLSRKTQLLAAQGIAKVLLNKTLDAVVANLTKKSINAPIHERLAYATDRSTVILNEPNEVRSRKV